MAASMAGKISSPLLRPVTRFPSTTGGPRSVPMSRRNCGSPTAAAGSSGRSMRGAPPARRFRTTSVTRTVARTVTRTRTSFLKRLSLLRAAVGDSLLGALLRAQGDRSPRGLYTAPEAVGPHLRELRSQEEDLRGVVDPQQQHQHRPGGAVAGGDAAPSQVEAEQLLPD